MRIVIATLISSQTKVRRR